MSEFEWRNGMRKMGGPIEPSRDLWPDIEAHITAMPQPRRSRMPEFAIAATLLVACASALIIWQMRGTQPVPPPVVAVVQKPVINRIDSDDVAPHKVLTNAADDLDDASSSIQQALEQRPDAVFLVGLLNRTNGQRMRVLKQSTAG